LAYWLNMEALLRLGSNFAYHGGDFDMKYFANPDLTLALNLKMPGDKPGWRGLTATAAADIFYLRSKLNSYYANIFYSAGRDSNNPFVQGLAGGVQFNYFRFPYEGNFPERYRIIPTLKYTIDLKEFDLWDRHSVLNDMIKIGIELGPIYEYAIDYYRAGDKQQSITKDNLGLFTAASLIINLGQFRIILSYRYEGIYQDVPGYFRLNERWLSNHQGTAAFEFIF